MSTPPARPAAAPAAPPVPRPGHTAYRVALEWAFGFFSTTRVLTYLPTLWAIHASADPSHHSLLTWLAWVGSNAVMSAWLYERNGHHVDKAVLVMLGNAVMCALTCGLIVWYR